MCARHMSSTFFLTKNDNNKKNHYKITIKPLKSKLKILNGKGNEVIALLICKKIKILLELNNNNNKKNHYEIIIKLLKSRVTNFNGKGNRVIQLLIKKFKITIRSLDQKFLLLTFLRSIR